MMRSLRIASFISLNVLGLISSGNAAQIRVQFMNGKNSKPITRTNVVINDVTIHKLVGILQTDERGFVTINVDKNSMIQALVERSFHQSCSEGKNKYQAYSVNQILSRGIVERNQCGAALSPSTPGTLVRVFRRSTFIEALREN